MTSEELANLPPEQRQFLAQREELWRAALERGLANGRKIRQILQTEGRGLSLDDLPELAPLTAEERTLVLRELRKLLGLPPS